MVHEQPLFFGINPNNNTVNDNNLHLYQGALAL